MRQSDDAYKILHPRQVPFISYSYDWSFGQLKAAALAIQKQVFDFGMTLKDANAFNIQFINGRPVLIDTLSVEKYREGQMWYGYGQFCRHFLALLALMHYRDVRLNQLVRVIIDGIDLDLAYRLLPWRSCFRY